MVHILREMPRESTQGCLVREAAEDQVDIGAELRAGRAAQRGGPPGHQGERRLLTRPRAAY